MPKGGREPGCIYLPQEGHRDLGPYGAYALMKCPFHAANLAYARGIREPIRGIRLVLPIAATLGRLFCRRCGPTPLGRPLPIGRRDLFRPLRGLLTRLFLPL